MATELAPELSHAEEEGLVLVGEAEDIRIVDGPSYERAGAMLLLIKTFRKKVADLTSPVIDATHRAWKAALAQRSALDGHAEEAERIIKKELGAWDQKQEELREAARREQERLQAAAEAEARRLADLETQRLQREAEARQRQEAERAKAAGDIAKAERIAAASVVVAPVAPRPVFVAVPPPAETPRVEGVSSREGWKAEVTDLAALVRAVAANQAPLACLQPDMKVLNGLARSLKKDLVFPGVKAVRDRIVSGKA